MTQAQVAQHLEVSRSTVAQIELGNRAVTGLELEQLAYLFGRDIREFLSREFREEEGLVALFRNHADVSEHADIVNVLRKCLRLGRELASLEELLGIGRDFGAIASYPAGAPSKKWDAIQQGERIAEEERRRLGLGNAPILNVVEVLETQGVRTAQVALPDDVSGLTLVDSSIGSFVVVNSDHPSLRRRFSYAHEYCHVLMDRERRQAISSQSNRSELVEVRANSFAAQLLLPAEGVKAFLNRLGKGHPSRSSAEIFDESDALTVRERALPGSQDIQLYDVVLLAHHFKASRLATIYRLRNLKLIAEARMTEFLELEADESAARVEELLGLPDPDAGFDRDRFRHRFLGLGLEGMRRGEITKSKLIELAALVKVSADDIGDLLQETDLHGEEEIEALTPAT